MLRKYRDLKIDIIFSLPSPTKVLASGETFPKVGWVTEMMVVDNGCQKRNAADSSYPIDIMHHSNVAKSHPCPLQCNPNSIDSRIKLSILHIR